MIVKNKKIALSKRLIIAIIGALIVAAVIWLSVSSVNANKSDYNFNIDKAQGIDVSEHNKSLDWKRLRNSQDFAIIRVGYRGYGSGKIMLDKTARYNLKNATKQGIPVGVYFYSQAINEDEAVEEAEFVLRHIKHYDISLPIFIDFEYATNSKGKLDGRLYLSKNSKEDNTKILNAFCSRIDEAGYSYGIYASQNMFNRKIDAKNLDKNSVIWVANYSSKPQLNDIEYTIWQYSQVGQLEGNGSSAIDQNYWYKEKVK